MSKIVIVEASKLKWRDEDPGKAHGPPMTLNPTDSNGPFKMLVTHVRRHGQLLPILVTRSYHVLRHHYLLLACLKAGIDLVEVEISN